MSPTLAWLISTNGRPRRVVRRAGDVEAPVRLAAAEQRNVEHACSLSHRAIG